MRPRYTSMFKLGVHGIIIRSMLRHMKTTLGIIFFKEKKKLAGWRPWDDDAMSEFKKRKMNKKRRKSKRRSGDKTK